MCLKRLESREKHIKQYRLWLVPLCLTPWPHYDIGCKGCQRRKLDKRVKQAHFGVITDAIESIFSFAKLDTSDYTFDAFMPEDASLQDVKKRAQEIELTLKDFYSQAAKQSEGLMTDLSRLFKKIAYKRENRLTAFLSGEKNE